MHKDSPNRLASLWEALCRQAEREQYATARDREVFREAFAAGGIPFLSDGLATLGRTALQGLRTGVLDIAEIASQGFEIEVGSNLPVFLNTIFATLFDKEGRVLRTEDGHWDTSDQACGAVRWIRQLTVVFSKLKGPYETAKQDAVVESFVKNEEFLAACKGALLNVPYLRSAPCPVEGQTLDMIILRASRLIHRVLCNCDVRDIVPRHGSGASACGRRVWERYTQPGFRAEFDAIWPFGEYVLTSHSPEWDSAFRHAKPVPRCAKYVLVPKDYRGPRGISEEPADSMAYQLGVMTRLVDYLEHHRATRGFVNFRDQSINQRLSHQGSQSRGLATVDLKDASDLLSWDLVLALWPRHFVKALTAVRSLHTVLPDGRKVALRKHAPMGSAVCFPVMALTLWALIKAAAPPRTPVWVYGDDVIVPDSTIPRVFGILTAVGLKVNVDKSFFGETPFRESCGKEYYGGTDVTPIYCRYDDESKVSAKASLVAFVNNITLRYGVGWSVELVEITHSMTGAPVWPRPLPSQGTVDGETHLWTKFGIAQRELPALVLIGLDDPARRPRLSRWNKCLQRREYRVEMCCPVYAYVPEGVCEAGFLNRWFVTLDKFFCLGVKVTKTLKDGSKVTKRRIRYAVANRVAYKYRWTCLDW